MAKVMPGRFTAQIDGPFVVFIIGMRVNKFLAFRKWIPTAMAMGPMIRTLYEHPEKGFLGAKPRAAAWAAPMSRPSHHLPNRLRYEVR